MKKIHIAIVSTMSKAGAVADNLRQIAKFAEKNYVVVDNEKSTSICRPPEFRDFCLCEFLNGKRNHMASGTSIVRDFRPSAMTSLVLQQSASLVFFSSSFSALRTECSL